MLVVKTLSLTNDCTTDFKRCQIEGFTVEELTLPYGASLAGLRFESVHYNVDQAHRNEHYDALVNAYRARAGLYEQILASDIRNRNESQVRALTTAEVREIAKGKEAQLNEQQT